MKIHHLDIFSKFYKKDGLVFVIPELYDPIEQHKGIELPKNKLLDGNGGSNISIAGNLIVTDKSLIEDLKNMKGFLIFTAAYSNYFINNHLMYNDEWDESLSVNDLYFLGWSINSYTDSAILDGVFPVAINAYSTKNKSDIIIYDRDAINNWGLIKDTIFLDKYIKKNQEEVQHFLINEDGSKTKLETCWEPIGIYCDSHTFKKLCEFR